METRIPLYLTLLILLLPTQAFACGESLYRVGRGIAYRTYSAPLPGNLLFIVSTPEDRAMAEQLAEAGHQVQVIPSAENLARQLELGAYDIVIAPFDQRELVEAGLGEATTSSTQFLPIATGGEQKRDARRTYTITVTSQGELKDYLKAIHRGLKEQV